MIDKRITNRKNFQGGGRDASTTSFSQSFDRQHGTNTASRANKTVDRQQREGQNQADRDNRRIELNRLARQSAAEKEPDVKPNPFQRGGGKGIGGLLMSLLGFAMGIPGLGLAFSKKGMNFINEKFRGTNPDGSIRTQAQYEQEMEDRRKQKRLDKLFAVKDRGFNQIGFGNFTKKTVDFTPGQQAKIDELLAQGVRPSTARNVLTGRDLNLRNTLNNNTIKELATPDINNASLVNEFGQSPQFNTGLINEFGVADKGIMDSNAAFAFGLPYGTADEGFVSPYGTADDQGANLLGVPEMTASLPNNNYFVGLTDKQKMLLDQRKGMLDALGDQGILDTIRSEDDPNDPATLEDVRNYYNIA
tara:strand:- start:335 stop:1417 length:1083 start_codon:yes stop_codon:yes gene_type:complete